jgi:CRP/FNR family cyclic AMP-dependent transcriptional regulator
MRAGRPREFRPGEVVFHQGDPCDSLFLLRRGRVSVQVLTPDGDDVTIGLIASPDAFGEVGLIRPDHHHPATVVALDEVHVLSVLATRFHDLRRDHPDLTDWLLLTLTQRLERMSALLADALFVDAEHRVARRLLDCRCSFGVDGAEPLPLTQDDLAAMAGVSRPTASVGATSPSRTSRRWPAPPAERSAGFRGAASGTGVIAGTFGVSSRSRRGLVARQIMELVPVDGGSVGGWVEGRP